MTNREMYDAFSAMCNDINETFGNMRSQESTLLDGPEMSHECAAVVESMRAVAAERDRLREALEKIANHLPSFEYCGSDDFGLRPDIPGSPYDRGKEEAHKLMAGIARAALQARNAEKSE